MVFFTCDACGESLKKAQVEKHLLKCRGCRVLSCIDCGNDFRGDDYKNHNKCISEDQKYGGKDFQAKANKGDVKQQQWIQRIQEASDRPGVQPRLQQILRQVAAYGNVPRKRAKFQNWMKNSLKIHSPELLEQVWEIFSAADSDCNQTTEEHKPNRIEPTNGTETNEGKREERKDKKSERERERERESSEQQNGKKQSRKKRKREEREQDGQNTEEKTKKRREEPSDESQDLEGEEPENQQSDSNSTGKFNWKGTIKAVLRDAPEDGLAVKKLRKKVLAAYYSFTGDGNYRSEEELLSLFNKKINNNPKFKTLKEKVRLVK